MTDETPITDEQTPNPDAKGLTPGVTVDQTDGTKRGDGAPEAPVITNTPPPKEQTAEEKQAEADKAKAAEAAKADEPPKTDEKTDEVPAEYPDYGNDTANAVVATLKESGVTTQEAHEYFKEAVDTGDFAKVDMSKLVEKLGKSKADLVMAGAQSYYNEVTRATKVIVAAAHEAVGGADNYSKIQAWSRAKADKDADFNTKVEALNAMFDLNKTAAVMAAKELKGLYEADKDNSSLTMKQVHGDAASTTADTRQETITREQYLTQVKAAHEKGDSAEVARLQSQRQASRRK